MVEKIKFEVRYQIERRQSCLVFADEVNQVGFRRVLRLFQVSAEAQLKER